MDKWLKVSIVMAVLLAGAGAFYHLVPGVDEGAAPPWRNAWEESGWPTTCNGQRPARGLEAGQASPGQADGHAECDLPDAKAAVVNAWLDQDEQRCMAEMRAGLDR